MNNRRRADGRDSDIASIYTNRWSETVFGTRSHCLQLSVLLIARFAELRGHGGMSGYTDPYWIPPQRAEISTAITVMCDNYLRKDLLVKVRNIPLAVGGCWWMEAEADADIQNLLVWSTSA